MGEKSDFKYQVIAEDLQRQIMSGNLAGREYFPSELLLTKRYKVNRRTIRQAVNSLEELDIISPMEKRKRRILVGRDDKLDKTIAFAAYGRIEQNQFSNLSAYHLFDEVVMHFQRHRIKVVKVLFDQNNPDYVPEIMDSNGIDLVLVFGNINPDIFRQKKHKYILIDVKPESDTICVNLDGSSATIDAYNYLVAKGHNKIGFMRYSAKYYSYSEMSAGYRAAAESFEHEPQFFEIPPSSNIPLEQFIDFFRKISKKLSLLDALIISTNVGVDKIIMALKAIGLKVPENISLVAIGGYENPEDTIPRLSCYENDYQSLACILWEISHAVSIGLLTNNLRINAKVLKLCERDSVIDRTGKKKTTRPPGVYFPAANSGTSGKKTLKVRNK